jgi:hypothetical protein
VQTLENTNSLLPNYNSARFILYGDSIQELLPVSLPFPWVHSCKNTINTSNTNVSVLTNIKCKCLCVSMTQCFIWKSISISRINLPGSNCARLPTGSLLLSLSPTVTRRPRTSVCHTQTEFRHLLNIIKGSRVLDRRLTGRETCQVVTWYHGVLVSW